MDIIYFLAARNDTSIGDMITAWIIVAIVALMILDKLNDNHDEYGIGCIFIGIIVFSVIMLIFLGFAYLFEMARTS